MFNRSLCGDLEELDVNSVLLDIVSTISRYLLNLKILFVMGEEVESWPANATDVLNLSVIEDPKKDHIMPLPTYNISSICVLCVLGARRDKNSELTLMRTSSSRVRRTSHLS